MLELDAVLADAVPLIGAAVGAYGAGVLSRVEDAAADATLSLGRRLIQRVWRRAPRPARLEGAVADLAAAPGDVDALAALRFQVRVALAGDPDLLSDVAAMLPARVAAAGANPVAIGGDVQVSAHGGFAGGVIHGPVVLVNPLVPGPERG